MEQISIVLHNRIVFERQNAAAQGLYVPPAHGSSTQLCQVENSQHSTLCMGQHLLIV